LISSRKEMAPIAPVMTIVKKRVIIFFENDSRIFLNEKLIFFTIFPFDQTLPFEKMII
jgi:hypothetical protein